MSSDTSTNQKLYWKVNSLSLYLKGGLGVVRGYDSVARACQAADLKKPEKITSVTLRKYMATVTQVQWTDNILSDCTCAIYLSFV